MSDEKEARASLLRKPIWRCFYMLEPAIKERSNFLEASGKIVFEEAERISEGK